jgi:hypothetical protein
MGISSHIEDHRVGRRSVRGLYGLLALCFICNCHYSVTADPGMPEPARNSSIGYFNREVPDVELNLWSGRRYEQLVPDTLDIADRAALGIHAITGIADPEMDYEWYFLADFYRKPPVLTHTVDTINCQYKVMEALPLLRLITGSELNLQVDQRWMEVALQLIGPDGLAYWPVEGRPWGKPKSAWVEPVIGDVDQGQFCTPSFLGRLVAAMTLYDIQEHDPVWNRHINRMIERLSQLVIEKGDFAYFPAVGLAPGAEVTPDMPMPTGFWASLPGWLVQGLAQYYRESGHEPALQLAEKLARYMMYHGEIFGEDGSFTGFDHFHHHTVVVLGIVELGRVTGRREYIDFARRAYDFGKSNGDSLVGFFSEGIREKDKDGNLVYRYRKAETAETCEIADMIAIGLKLARAGHLDCIDDVDRWVRNHFAESQMLRCDWVDRVQDKHDEFPEMKVQPGETADRVAERHIGAFAGWSLGNDFLPLASAQDVKNVFMHCCLSNGTRALYYIWDHIAREENGKLKVNLLLNHASKWADIHSYIPYEGRVDIHVRKTCELEVRIPDWVKPTRVRCSVNGEDRPLEFNGRYALAGKTGKGDVAEITFPISERTVRTSIGGTPYTVIIKGNEVVFMDPPGLYYPLYQRDHYRNDSVRWVKRERFVADRELHW